VNGKPKDWRNRIKTWLAEIGLAPNLRTLYLAIADYWNPNYGYAFPGVDRLARDTGWDERSVRRMLRRLEAFLIEGTGKPILRIEYGGGRWKTNRYFLAFFDEALAVEETLTGGPPFDRQGISTEHETLTVVLGNPDPRARNPDRRSENPDRRSPDPVVIRDRDPREGSCRRSPSKIAQSTAGKRRMPDAELTVAQVEERRRYLREQARKLDEEEELKRRETA